MAETDVDNVVVMDQEAEETPYSVTPVTTDGPSEEGETKYINTKWAEYLGYYKAIPEIKIAVDTKTFWALGNGFRAPVLTEMALSSITGITTDTFLSVLQNLDRVSHIGGDSFAEIIRNKEDRLINLKPIDPGVVQICANPKGRIVAYEILSKTGTKAKVVQRLSPDRVFHLMSDRIADEIHGESKIRAVEDIIVARKEAMDDYRLLLRRHVRPVKYWEVDEDDSTKLDSLQAKFDQAYSSCENVLIPKGTVAPPTIVAVSGNATLNPLPWIQQLNNYFYQVFGVPMIVVGGAPELTEAAGKVTFLAWEQTVRQRQLYLEEQVLLQLNLEIELDFPVTVQNELLSDNQKDGPMKASTPEDTAVTGVPLNSGVASI